MELDFIEDLKADPIFAMSLSSKEVFHSNVLAWFLVNSKTNKSFGKVKELFGIPAGGKVLAVFREKENFDVLVLHGSIEKPELVLIENKFKAIPEKKQLAEYSEKLARGFSLELSDADGKACKIRSKDALIRKYVFAPELILSFFYEQIKDDGWGKVSYEEYLACIEKVQPESSEDGLIISKYAKMTETIIEKIIKPVLLEKETELKVMPDEVVVNRLFEIRMHDLYIKMWHSKALSVINNSIQAANYDYCGIEFTPLQGLLNWKKTVVCGEGKLYAGVQIKGNSFRITVEPYCDYENGKEIYSFKDKNISSPRYKQVAEWENKILEELSVQFDFFKKGKQREEPYKYDDFKYMKLDMKPDTMLSELAKAVKVALEFIVKDSDSLKKMGFEFSKDN